MQIHLHLIIFNDVARQGDSSYRVCVAGSRARQTYQHLVCAESYNRERCNQYNLNYTVDVINRVRNVYN